ncbi:hypothetical protein HDV00_007677 [Rhizophlyctis rosea]|nr:hypothetical protein HDV00_007677 [Rhizophlyctis rosea]
MALTTNTGTGTNGGDLSDRPYVSMPSAATRERLLKERQERAAAASATTSSTDLHNKNRLRTCQLCSVSFDITKEAHHLQSKQHRTNLAGKEEKKKGGEVIEDEKDTAMDETVASKKTWENEMDCLFCLKTSEDIESNFKHMKSSHSFFIPDFTYLSQPVELLAYLAAIIEHGNCLYCHSPEARAAKQSEEDDDSAQNDPFTFDTPGAFATPQDARRHMIAKGHCKVFWENGAQIAVDGMYDWGVSEDDLEEDIIPQSTQKPTSTTDTLTLPSGTRILTRTTPRPPPPSQSQPLSDQLIVRNGRPLPVQLSKTLLSMKPSERNAVLRCTKKELYMMANFTPSQLTAVAKTRDAAFRAGVKEWRYRSNIGGARKGGGANQEINSNEDDGRRRPQLH